ncbi:EAL domain-containing protein [Amphritea sp. 1_MG-2023]|uniref:EAL domain-containing protein n=1 Tax=Amphritea sp. 1_MG-2023 TaxID=3062670 RepID=UPI0026E12670|nr:EAL domain-containing protein [Amphritea sp. 1_MG-2023]MDO6563437.1 EAL domain-containing protein [Amphritea sp. 1_MG-2023]
MSGQVTTSAPTGLFNRVVSEKRQRLRKNIQILFLGLTAEEVDPIITLLRGARLSPRGQQVQSAEEFNVALSERSWDIILSPQVEGQFGAKEAAQILQRLSKDIPIIQLVPNSDSQTLLQGLKARMATVISLEEQELLLIQIRRQLEHLETRRRLRIVEAELAQTDKQCQALVSLAGLPIIYLSNDFLPIYSNPAFAELFGLDENDSGLHETLDKFTVFKDRDQLKTALEDALDSGSHKIKTELKARRIDGTNFQATFTIQSAHYMSQDCLQVMISPNNDTSEATFENIDPTTRLYDGNYLVNALEKAAHRALTGGADCSLLYIRFDNYSALQSELGVTSTDIVLSDIADLLQQKINKTHLCARLEEDVFAILFHDPSPDKAMKLADLLCTSIAQLKIDVTGTVVTTSCSIGVCSINDNAPDYIELIERARLAADEARNNGQRGNSIKLFETTAEETADIDDASITMIYDALKHDKFRILFQPIVALTSSNEGGNYEVFLRLQDNNDVEGLSPNIFLSTLDHADTNIQIDKWVIEHTFMQMAEQLKTYQRSRVFINLTASFYQDPEDLNWLADKLKAFRIPAELVVFQVSESDLSTSQVKAEQFRFGLKQLGCKFCIKHFGISENRELLRIKLKPDLIKLDGSYIQDLGSSAEADQVFAELIKNLKHADIRSIAPLVEDTRLMGKLWQVGVNYIQGYYLQPPTDEMNYDFFE